MLFVEFFGEDGFNKHFTKLETAVAYIQQIVELEIYDINQINLYQLVEEDDIVYKEQLMWLDVNLIRKAKKNLKEG